jgi:hypothetical protein
VFDFQHTPKPKIRKNKPKLQVMSEEILKAIKNKKTAFYNWKTNGRIKDIHDITCNIGLFFLIFGFGVIALAALFMRLFRLRKAFSTSLAVSKVRFEDCILYG